MKTKTFSKSVFTFSVNIINIKKRELDDKNKIGYTTFADQSVDSRNIADGTIQAQDISGFYHRHTTQFLSLMIS